MSGNEYDNDEYDYDDDGSTVLRQLRKENRSKEKQIKELQEQLSAINTQTRERSVRDVLTAKGLNPKIARFVPEDVTSDEDVAAWINEYADVFGGATQVEGDTDEAETSAPQIDTSGYSQNGQVQQSGSQFNGDPGQLAALIQSARSPEELNKVLFGSEGGPAAF